MTTSASDILSVVFLQKEAKIKDKLRVVPLFETLDDLINSRSIMQTLFSQKWYRKLINNKQEVMIGYSDSSKDAGKICASWHQYKAQEEIVNLAKKFKIEVIFFMDEVDLQEEVVDQFKQLSDRYLLNLLTVK